MYSLHQLLLPEERGGRSLVWGLGPRAHSLHFPERVLGPRPEHQAGGTHAAAELLGFPVELTHLEP